MVEAEGGCQPWQPSIRESYEILNSRVKLIRRATLWEASPLACNISDELKPEANLPSLWEETFLIRFGDVLWFSPRIS